MKKNDIGKTGLKITDLSFGATSLSSMPDIYGYEVTEERAQKTLKRFFEGPVNMLDTSRNYGFGKSEELIGLAIEKNGGWPKDFVLSTKLDRNMETGNFDAKQARKSFDESLTTLKLDKIDILHLHDPEHTSDVSEITKKDGALDELFKIKEEGLVKAVGLAMGRIDIMFPILKDWDFDVLINHNRFTLLNRQADEMYNYAAKKGIAIINAAPFAGGVLAKGSKKATKITYQDTNKETLAPVIEIEEICEKFNIEIGAAALQFSMKDSRISSTLCGVSSPESIEKNLLWSQTKIPNEFWEEVLALPYSKNDPEANRIYVPT